MLKSALSNGYSSQVRGWLMLNGVQLELAQVGPDFCILREPISGDIIGAGDVPAELIIEVDGSKREVAILLISNATSFAKKLHFRTLHNS